MADEPTLSEREQKLAKAYKRKRELPDDPEDARLVAGLITGGVLPLEKSAQSGGDEGEPVTEPAPQPEPEPQPEPDPDTK